MKRTRILALTVFANILTACWLMSAEPESQPDYTDQPINLTSTGTSSRREKNVVFPDCILCLEERREGYDDAKRNATAKAAAQCRHRRGELLKDPDFSEKGCKKHNDFAYPIGFPFYYFYCEVEISAVCRIPRLRIEGPALNSLSVSSPAGIFSGK